MMSVADPVLASTANTFTKRKYTLDDPGWCSDFQSVSVHNPLMRGDNKKVTHT